MESQRNVAYIKNTKNTKKTQ